MIAMCMWCASDDKDASAGGRENGGTGSGDEQEDDDDETLQFYDRSKSFFDNISCESSERAKGSVTVLRNVQLTRQARLVLGR